jgi:predicted Zn-dependent peptidase
VKVSTMYRKSVLKNGVRVISEQVDHLRSVSLGIWVDAGSRDEKEAENGVSHLIEHMLFRGTPTRTNLQIAKELDVIGGLSNAFTGKENTCFHARVLGKHFTVLSDILSDIFLHSTFEPEDLEREKQVILQEISMTEDTPDDHIHVLFQELFWQDHPIGKSILGTSETVSSMKRETVLEYMNRFYAPERILVVAAGSIDHERLASTFEPLFESIPQAATSLPRSLPRCHTGVSFHPKELEQVHICLGSEAPSLGTERRFAGAVLNTILGGNMSSRLFQEVREKRGLAYSIYSFLSAYMDVGLLGVYFGTDFSNVNPALEVIQTEIAKIKRGEISEPDLARAKDYLIGGIYLGSESADNRMMRIAKNEFIFERYIGYRELAESLEKVTMGEVVACAQDVFKQDKMCLTVLGPVKEEDLHLGSLHFG